MCQYVIIFIMKSETLKLKDLLLKTKFKCLKSRMLVLEKKKNRYHEYLLVKNRFLIEVIFKILCTVFQTSF